MAGAIESVYKRYYADQDEDFDKEISVDLLVSNFRKPGLTVDTLKWIKENGVTTEDGSEVVRIKDFEILQPQFFTSDLAYLMTHILTRGVVVGVFYATVTYDEDTVYYQDLFEIASSEEDKSELDRDEDSYFEDEGEDYFEGDREEDLGEDDLGDYFEGDREEDLGEEDLGDYFEGDREEDLEDYFEGDREEDKDGSYHAVILVSLGIDEDGNLFFGALDSHGTEAGDNGFRKIAVYLIKEAYIIEPNV